MAYVTYKLVDGGRQVDGVFRTQSEANSAARASAAITAQGTRVSDAVETGDYINSAGHILGKSPNIASVRNAQQLRQLHGNIQGAFQAGVDVQRRGDWRRNIRADGGNRNAAIRYRYHHAALAWQIAGAALFGSLSRSDRFDLVEHVVKELSTDLYRWFRKDVTTSRRDAWAALAVSDGTAIRSDLVSAAGAARQPDGSTITVTGATIPTGFVDTLHVG